MHFWGRCSLYKWRIIDRVKPGPLFRAIRWPGSGLQSGKQLAIRFRPFLIEPIAARRFGDAPRASHGRMDRFGRPEPAHSAIRLQFIDDDEAEDVSRVAMILVARSLAAIGSEPAV